MRICTDLTNSSSQLWPPKLHITPRAAKAALSVLHDGGNKAEFQSLA